MSTDRLHLPWSFKRQIQEHTLPGFLHCSGMWVIFFICSEFYIENMPCCISNIIAVLTEHNEHSTNACYSHQIEVEVDGGTGSKTVRQAGFGGYCCVFFPCSAALTLPVACPGVCRLCGLYQEASQENLPSSLTNSSP